MKLGLHLRNISESEPFPDLPAHLRSVFSTSGCEIDMRLEKPWIVDHIYTGDEFCLFRLPSAKKLTRFLRFATDRDMHLILLLPVLTDAGIDSCQTLFERLKKAQKNAGVVANDIGTILFLRKHYPELSVSMGRLFNKAFKDPRLSTADIQTAAGHIALMDESTFDQAVFPEILNRLQINRLERDLLPWSKEIPLNERYETAWYFPYGYVTTGRVCRTAAFGKTKANGFSMSVSCKRPCDGLSFRLKHESVSLSLVQAGNTVFYLYPPQQVSALLRCAESNDVRLIYQGVAI